MSTQILDKNKTEENPQEEIVYEEITVRVPKKVMDLLRAFEKVIQITPKAYIEYNIIEVLRADLDADALFTMEKIVENFDLEPIFQQHDK
jgi:methylphosphotriester-DNA--protein-cysteine methyltransferase